MPLFSFLGKASGLIYAAARKKANFNFLEVNLPPRCHRQSSSFSAISEPRRLYSWSFFHQPKFPFFRSSSRLIIWSNPQRKKRVEGRPFSGLPAAANSLSLPSFFRGKRKKIHLLHNFGSYFPPTLLVFVPTPASEGMLLGRGRGRKTHGQRQKCGFCYVFSAELLHLEGNR